MAQTGSFIPKQAKPAENRTRTRTVRKVYLFSYISYVVFFGTLLVVAAMFLYEIHLNNNLSTQKSLLAAERESFSQSDIERVRELDRKLIIANQLFSKHVSVATLLDSFEDTTLQNVQFQTFTFAREPDNTYLVMAGASTEDFDSLLFQRQVIKEDDLFADAELRNITYEPGESADGVVASDPRVLFEFHKTLSAGDLSFVAQGSAASQSDATTIIPPSAPDVITFDEEVTESADETDFFDTVDDIATQPVGDQFNGTIEDVNDRFDGLNQDIQ